jgi:hypothetical protein
VIPFFLVLLVAGATPSLPQDQAAEEDTRDASEDTLDTGQDAPAEEAPFLSPYYEAGDSTAESSGGGCFQSDGCFTVLDVVRVIGLIRVSHHSDPFSDGETRSELGDDGNLFGLSASAGIARLDGGKGAVAEARLLTPCPVGIEVLYHRVPDDDSRGFSLLYAGAPFQLAYGSPLQVALSLQVVFPREDGRYALTGTGVGLAAEYFFLDEGGASIDYRLVWVNGLPLHRGELRLSWYMLPAELWAGYAFIMNSDGEVLDGPSAGIGILL